MMDAEKIKNLAFVIQKILSLQTVFWHLGFCQNQMVVVAQLVRAPDCGSGGRRFEPGLPPFKKSLLLRAFAF